MSALKLPLILLAAAAISCSHERQPIYMQADAPVDERVADLLDRMTLDEKIGQLSCPMGWDMYEKKPDGSVAVSEAYRGLMQSAPVGSLWAVLRADPWTRKTLETGLNPALAAEATNALQRYAVDSTRLGIPLLIAEECPHGHMAIGATVFPTSLAQASTWNPALIRQMGEAIALEARSQGANIGYGPVLDIARDPRWSRMEESYGEDPVLAGEIGVAMMQGMQGEEPADGKHLFSTLKHFAAYGMPEAGHNGGRTNAGTRQLLGEYLPQFKKAVEGGAKSIMTSYNSIDGVPCTASKYLLDDVLRGEWGFNGMVYSDLFSIEGIAQMRAAADRKEAAAKALAAGVDMDLGGQAYSGELKQALDEGLISMADIDRAVANVLRLKFEQGLFENPYVDPAQAEAAVRSEAHRNLAREVASQGTVLLKNNGILPLASSTKRVAVIGPNADTPYNQLGDYTAPQAPDAVVTILDGMRAAMPDASVEYAKGCAVRDTEATDIPSAVRAAKNADVAIVVLGGSSARDFKTKYIDTGAATADADAPVTDMDCGEGFDRATLRLLGDQEKLLQAVIATGTPTVVVYVQGRTLDMNAAASNADALLTCWYPGEQGGAAVADIITGKTNPAGRLPVSVPRHEGQIPVFYSQYPKAYMDMDATPLFPFGFGLSYTTFEYSDLKIDASDGFSIEVSCTVANTGDRDGDEVVQLYLTDEAASVAQPPLLLKAFRRVSIPKGQKSEVSFSLTPADLEIYGLDMKRAVEPGEFTIQIGGSSASLPLQGKFTI